VFIRQVPRAPRQSQEIVRLIVMDGAQRTTQSGNEVSDKVVERQALSTYSSAQFLRSNCKSVANECFAFNEFNRLATKNI